VILHFFRRTVGITVTDIGRNGYNTNGGITEIKGNTNMPTTDAGKAIACRNATTHGLFARDVVLPSLGEDPEGYRRLEAEWMAQLPPRTLLERHYVEKIAAASWRLRRLHRWQAQLFEEDGLTESERLDRLDKVMRHETALHRQIDTAVKMLAKDAPQLFARRVREQVLEDTQISERECREDAEDDRIVALETRSRLYQIGKATRQAVTDLSVDSLDTGIEEICQNELPPTEANAPAQEERADENQAGNNGDTLEYQNEKCQNEPAPFHWDPRRVTEYLDPKHPLPDAGWNRRRRGQRRFAPLAPP